MALKLPWIQKKQEKADLDARKHNSAEENELLDLAIHRFGIAQAEKTDQEGRPLNEKMRELDQIYRGRQWKGYVPPHKSKPVLNFTFSLVESVIPRITDNRPEITVQPRSNRTGVRLAEQLTNTQEHLWEINRMRRQMPSVVRTMLKYGTAIMKTTWDENFHDGELGDVRYTSVHPMNFYPDPRAQDINGINGMEYCFVHVPKSLEYYIRHWPDKGHLVVSDSDWTTSEQIDGAGDTSGEERATLTEYWFKDEDGNMCVMYYAGHVVLGIIGGKYDDTNSPVYRHNRFPFTRLIDYEADKEFWGIGEVEIITLLQRLINNFEAQIIDNTRLMSNAQWIVNKTLSGLKEEDAWIFDNRPGEAIFTHNGGVERIAGVPIPPHIPEHMERLIFSMEQILGIHDVVQGRRPVGVRAASAIIALQESANVRVREKSRNMEESLQDMGDQANWLILEHYEEPRHMRIAGMSTPVTLNIHETLQKSIMDLLQEDPTLVEDLGINLEDPETMTPEDMEMLMGAIPFPSFDLTVNAGPSIPYSQALRYEQAKEFYQLGIIDRQAVLEVADFPNRKEILARIEGQMAAQAQEQGQQGERVGERTFGPALGRR